MLQRQIIEINVFLNSEINSVTALSPPIRSLNLGLILEAYFQASLQDGAWVLNSVFSLARNVMSALITDLVREADVMYKRVISIPFLSVTFKAQKLSLFYVDKMFTL